MNPDPESLLPPATSYYNIQQFILVQSTKESSTNFAITVTPSFPVEGLKYNDLIHFAFKVQIDDNDKEHDKTPSLFVEEGQFWNWIATHISMEYDLLACPAEACQKPRSILSRFERISLENGSLVFPPRHFVSANNKNDGLQEKYDGTFSWMLFCSFILKTIPRSFFRKGVFKDTDLYT